MGQKCSSSFPLHLANSYFYILFHQVIRTLRKVKLNSRKNRHKLHKIMLVCLIRHSGFAGCGGVAPPLPWPLDDFGDRKITSLHGWSLTYRLLWPPPLSPASWRMLSIIVDLYQGSTLRYFDWIEQGGISILLNSMVEGFDSLPKQFLPVFAWHAQGNRITHNAGKIARWHFTGDSGMTFSV